MRDTIENQTIQIMEANIDALRNMLDVTAHRASIAHQDIATHCDVTAAVGGLLSIQYQLEDIKTLIDTVMAFRCSQACWVKA